MKHDCKPKNKFLTILITTHIQLLESVARLQGLEVDQKIVHFNLTDNTILYDIVNATPVITDFRMSFLNVDIDSIETFKSMIPSYVDYPGWPIEIFALSQLLEAESTEIITESGLTDIAAKFLQMPFFTTDYEFINDEYKNNITAFLQPFVGRTVDDFAGSVKQYSLSWDVYAISVYMILLIRQLQVPTSSYDFMKRYMESLYKVVLVSPDMRPDIPSIIADINGIFAVGVSNTDYYSFVDDLTLSINK